MCQREATLTTTTTTPGGTLPRPAEGSTETQLATVFAATGLAAAASSEARSSVITLFESRDVREGLEEYCPSVATLSGPELAERWESELRTVEVVSNFATKQTGPSNAGDVMSLEMINDATYWANEWQVLFEDGAENCTGYDIGNRAETLLYGFQNFSTGTCFPGTFLEATERPLYTMLNTQRVDVGNPSFGDIAVVWSRNFATPDATIVSPYDTGIWEFECDIPGNVHWIPDGNCETGGPPTAPFGTLASFFHLIPQSVAFYNYTSWLVNHACRLLSTAPWGTELELDRNNLLQYWEAVVAKAPYFEHHNVRFLVASFASLFGDDDNGADLRSICRKHKWILVWGFGDIETSADPALDAPVKRSLNGRLLDPLSLAFLDSVKHLYTENMTTIFNRHWDAAGIRRAQDLWQSRSPDASSWKDAYADLRNALPPSAQLRPLSSTDGCPDLNACIGATLITSSCLCYDDAIFFDRHSSSAMKS